MEKRIECTSFIDGSIKRSITTIPPDNRRHVQLSFFYMPKSFKPKLRVAYCKPSNRTGLISGLIPYNSLQEDENSIFISPLYGIYLVYKEMKDG